jgi:outer membrane biosynthesis protein TonB
MTVPEQIVILLALSGGLFDVVSVNRVQEAEEALQKIITELPKEILSRLFSDNDLSDADRETISKIAGDTLSPFIDKPKPESASETESKPKSKNEPEPELKSASETKPKPESKSKPKKEPEPDPDQNQK